MTETFEGDEHKNTEDTQEEQTCSLCRSPLIQEAIDAGKCQCCGHPINPAGQKVQSQ